MVSNHNQIPPRPLNAQGFTLLEVLIAITLLSLLMLGVYSLVNSSAITRDHTLREDQEFVEAETALYRLEADFALLYTPLLFSVRHTSKVNQNSNDSSAPEQTKNSSNSSLDKYEATERFPYISSKAIPIPAIRNDDKASISFLSSGNKRNFESAKESSFAWVKYALKAMEGESNEPGLMALVRYHLPLNPYAHEFEWESTSPSILLKNVKKLEFLFWDSQRKNFVDSLKNTNGDPNLIRVLKVVLEWVDKNQTEHKIERIFRITWPTFDAVKDDAEYNKALQQSRTTKTGKEGSGEDSTSPPNEPDEE
ncbi:MAG: prepilin-type N-terminal cleavage/methylation domain-containing protein [Bdellovibrio sp.]|nr:prepilin-type N-terminal cleavage/methylation domain-containing protein [Bdellovibrio sp.]